MAYFACKNGNSGGTEELVLYERGVSHLGSVTKGALSSYQCVFANDSITFNQYSTASSDFVTVDSFDISDWKYLKVYSVLAGDETNNLNKRILVADLESARLALGSNLIKINLYRTGNILYLYLPNNTYSSPVNYVNGCAQHRGSNVIKVYKIWLEK